MDRIGIFGGTFDPPHVGHLVTAVNVRHALQLDQVLLVVANTPWQKVGTRTITPAEDRLAMVTAAVRGVPGLEASSIEIERGGNSYTADTVATISDQYPSAALFVIVGADVAAGLDTWERASEVSGRVHLAVVDRRGDEGLAPPPGWIWDRVAVPRIDISSTELRRRRVAGAPLDYLVPKDVISCIAERGLYAPSSD